MAVYSSNILTVGSIGVLYNPKEINPEGLKVLLHSKGFDVRYKHCDKIFKNGKRLAFFIDKDEDDLSKVVETQSRKSLGEEFVVRIEESMGGEREINAEWKASWWNLFYNTKNFERVKKLRESLGLPEKKDMVFEYSKRELSLLMNTPFPHETTE